MRVSSVEDLIRALQSHPVTRVQNIRPQQQEAKTIDIDYEDVTDENNTKRKVRKAAAQSGVSGQALPDQRKENV